MLTKEQMKAIEDKASKAFRCSCSSEYCSICSTTWSNIVDAANDVTSLIAHIKELTQKAFCEHSWVYYFDKGFQCSNCNKTKDKL